MGVESRYLCGTEVFLRQYFPSCVIQRDKQQSGSFDGEPNILMVFNIIFCLFLFVGFCSYGFYCN